MALDALRSGFVSLCISTALNYLNPGASVVIEGQLPDETYEGSSPAQPEVLIEVPSAGQAEAFFGESILTECVKKAFCAASNNVKVFVLPHAPETTNAAAVYKLAFTGTATSPGKVQLFMLDSQYNIDLAYSIGATAAKIASDVAAVISAMKVFPYTATASNGDVTLTAKDRGEIGNYLTPVFNWTGNPGIAPAGITMTATRTTAGSGSWAWSDDAVSYASVLGECCYDAYVLLTGDTTLQNGSANQNSKSLQAWLESQWSCDTPQCFGQGYTWSAGTLGQVLATGSNAAHMCRLAYPVNDTTPPYFIVTEYGARSASVAQTQPQLAIQGETNGVLSCTYRPNACSQPWGFTDRKALDAAGFVVYGPATMGAGSLTHPMIYQDVTNCLTDDLGRQNVTYRSGTMARWAKAFSLVLSGFLEESFDGLSFFDSGTQIKPGVRATTQALAHGKIVDWLHSQEGVLISQLRDIPNQVVLTSDFETAPPCQGVPGKYALKLIVGPPIKAANFSALIMPKLLNNCPRGGVNF